TQTERADQVITTNEQFDPTPVLKTIFEQIDKPSPDRRTMYERIGEKSISLGRRLGRKLDK
ncbi:MAG: hypothetical protein V1253_03845, partial [Alphaproteobacteria bacterium]|nr:hypothetical protein [Alphaproteobacteria bacterium]